MFASFIDLGVGHIVFNLLVTPEQVMEQVEQLAHEVVPRIKQHRGDRQ